MNAAEVAANVLSPPILFFLLGLAAPLVRSDLEIPQSITKALSLYLLFAIGFRGGVELAHAELTGPILYTLLAAVVMSFVVPFYAYPILRRRFSFSDAGAMAATYGSVSAVTFITAAAFLSNRGIEFGGHMVAALALMESPAVIAGLLLIRVGGRSSSAESNGWSEILRHSVTNGAVFLLLGSLVIGLVARPEGAAALEPFTDDIFRGVLSLFLLDLGIVAARRLPDVRRAGTFLAAFAIGLPLLNAVIAIGIARAVGASAGDAILFIVLCASASYIAVPAAMRIAAPEAEPALYVSAALGVTFPFNVVIGIPLYTAVVEWIWR